MTFIKMRLNSAASSLAFEGFSRWLFSMLLLVIGLIVTDGVVAEPIDKTHNDIAFGVQFSSGVKTDDNPYGFVRSHLPTIQKSFKQAYDLGVRIFLVHRPFGEPRTEKPGPMQIDSAVHLEGDRDWKHVLDEYHVSRRWASKYMSDAIIIDYVGTIESDIEQLESNGQYAETNERLLQSVGPCMRHTNVSIGFDASVRFADDSKWSKFIMLIDHNKKIVVESIPNRKSRWSWSHDALVVDSFWRRGLVYSVYGEPLRTHRIYMDGNHVNLRIYDRNQTTYRWRIGKLQDQSLEEFFASCLYFGHTPMVESINQEILDEWEASKAKYTRRIWIDQPGWQVKWAN